MTFADVSLVIGIAIGAMLCFLLLTERDGMSVVVGVALGSLIGLALNWSRIRRSR